MINWDDFAKIDIRTGTIIDAIVFNEANKPAYKLEIDFGELGVKKSSAQITDLYTPNDIIGKQVIAVVNFPPKQIANMMSQYLVLGTIHENGSVTLLTTDVKVDNGLKIG